jgi:hypothetical protein
VAGSEGEGRNRVGGNLKTNPVRVDRCVENFKSTLYHLGGTRRRLRVGRKTEAGTTLNKNPRTVTRRTNVDGKTEKIKEGGGRRMQRSIDARDLEGKRGGSCEKRERE